MTQNKYSFLNFLQDHLGTGQQLVDLIVSYLNINYGFSNITIFKHQNAPDCYEPIGSTAIEKQHRKALIEVNKNYITPGSSIIKFGDLHFFPLTNHKEKVCHVLVIAGEQNQFRNIPLHIWSEINTLYKLAIANEEGSQERVWDKTVHIVSRMAHDLNSLVALIPARENGDVTIAERICYSQKLSEEIMVYLRDFSLQCSWYLVRELFEEIIAENEDTSGIKYRLNFEDNLNYVNVDLELIERALVALLDNAVTACKIEGNDIDVTLSREQNKSMFIDHDWLSVSIKDNGPGIPNEYISEVKKPFFTTWKDLGHIGVGLSMVDKIIQNHGGSLSIKSEPGKGTVTSFYLPLYDAKI